MKVSMTRRGTFMLDGHCFAVNWYEDSMHFETEYLGDYRNMIPGSDCRLYDVYN